MTALLTVLVLGVIVIALGVDVAAIGWCVKVFCRRRVTRVKAR